MNYFNKAWSVVMGLVIVGMLVGCAPKTVVDVAPSQALVWDAMQKFASPKFEDGEVHFEFHVTNASKEPVTIYSIRASCGCTTLESPPLPWTLAPGERGTLKAAVEFLGKEGELAKDIIVGSVEGNQRLVMVIQVPPMDPAMRAQNQAFASANRQLVFQGQCATCHAAPAESQFGIDLFEAACAICHQAEHRAEMVPDLHIAKEKRDALWWTRWIEDGREGTLMPGFAKKHGGPLSESQIESLVEYVMEAFPTEPASN